MELDGLDSKLSCRFWTNSWCVNENLFCSSGLLGCIWLACMVGGFDVLRTNSRSKFFDSTGASDPGRAAGTIGGRPGSLH